MTFRAKTAVKRDHRAPYEADHRRNILITIGFGLVVVVSLLILAGAAFKSYYDDHFAGLASVDGQSISKDEAREQYSVEGFKLDYAESRIRAKQDNGRLDAAAAESQLSEIANVRNSLSTAAVENLIDAKLQAQLAGPMGVAVTDQQVTDQMTQDATTPEMRHVWTMGAKPKPAPGAAGVNEDDKVAARAAADQALADLKAGKPWEEVAKTMTDDVYASKGGEVGWITKDGNALDSSIADLVFTLPANGLTEVVEGTDGTFRIARVTDIDPATVDDAFQIKLKDAGVSVDSYRKVARATALKAALSNRLVSEAVDQPSVQRLVSEIFLATAATPGGAGDEVKVRHILYSPNDDAQGAQAVPDGDAAWKKAEDEANAEYQALLKDPSTFQADATAKSDDTGTAPSGGELPYYTKADLDQNFANAIFQEGLQPGQILPPVKSAFGWHVIQYIGRQKQPADRMKDIQALAQQPGADFPALAAQYSEHDSKDKGGDIGWIAEHQLDSVRELAIFKAPVGGLSDIVQETDGIYLFKVIGEETRLPDADQADLIRVGAFDNWYSARKLETRITRDYTNSSESLPAVQ